MSRSELTKEQELAVLFREPENLLISAAAGSGKTTTLTRRIVSRLINGEIRPSELLVITFTEMAAKDLKVKIQGQLKTARKAASDPELSRRLDLLEAELSLAQISTIHAFCNQILLHGRFGGKLSGTGFPDHGGDGDPAPSGRVDRGCPVPSL
jgi:ATP-dependent helicase/nuclease subunit A